MVATGSRQALRQRRAGLAGEYKAGRSLELDGRDWYVWRSVLTEFSGYS
jgi:hypothetical protein